MKRAAAAVLIALACPLLTNSAAFSQDFWLDPDVAERILGINADAKKVEYHSQSAIGLRAVSPKSLAPLSLYPVRGLDISHHDNGDPLHPPVGHNLHMLNWARVVNQGFSFAFIKATDGRKAEKRNDPDFADNWRGAKNAVGPRGERLARGAYHFYNFCDSGLDQNGRSLAEQQAQNFIAVLSAADPGELPLAIDFEKSTDCAWMPTKKQFRLDLARFVKVLKDQYGPKFKPPIMYVNKSIYEQYFQGMNDPYPIWFADPRRAPQISDNKPWAFWQYEFFGNVDGVGDHVDLDVFNGTPLQFAAWVNPSGNATAALTHSLLTQ